jgi:hypothetical protein
MEGARFVDPEICRDYLIDGSIRSVGSLVSTLYGYTVGRVEDADSEWEKAHKLAEEDFLAKATGMGADIAAHFKTVSVKKELGGFVMLRGEAYETIGSEN